MSDDTHNPELEEMWEEMWVEAERECRKVNGLKDSEAFPKYSVEEVLKQLDASKIKETTDSHTKCGKAKEVLQKTLVLIDTLGNIAAQGASIVFGPSQICFNAVSFLIRSAQNYSKIFTGLTELFHRISAFLERFEVYTSTVSIDKRLKRLIHQLLQSFTRICSMSTKLAQSNKVLLYTKVFLFDTDEGVKKEMDKLECLVGDELKMSVALILQSAKITEATVAVGFVGVQKRLQDVEEHVGGKIDGLSSQAREILTNQERTEKESKSKEAAEISRQKIKSALAVRDDEPWALDHDNFAATLIPHSGDWLAKNNIEFSSWANAEANAKLVFAVEGGDGFGKSHLFSAVVRNLISLHKAPTANRRVAIAYYFLQSDTQEKKDTKEAHGAKQRDPLVVALRSIIWQLTIMDVGYRKAVAAACPSREESSDIEEVWNRLVVSQSNIDATFFVLLDGIENIESERGQRLYRIMRDTMESNNSSQRLRIQWFVTGSPSSFSSGGSTGLEESSLVSKITLGTCNKEDILKFIDVKMDEMKALATKADPAKATKSDLEILQLRSTIRERLSDGIAGDFTKLEYKLRDIGTKSRKDEIEEVLSHVTEDIGITIKRQLKRLNDELAERDVEDLNDLLVWIVAIGSSSPWSVTIAMLDEVLSLKAISRSLVPLQDRIKSNFAPLLELTPHPYKDDLRSATVAIAPSFLDYFTKASESKEIALVSGSSSILHTSEVAIVKRILKNFCDDDLFERFEFEEFFRQKAGGKKPTIHVDVESVHVTLVMTLVAALCDRPTTDCPLLIEYAIQSLGDHLSEDKWARANKASKKIAGSSLIRFFTEEDIINKIWDVESNSWEVRYYWIVQDSHVKNTLAWFKDPATTLGLSEQKRAWIDNLTSNASQQADLMKDVVLALAKMWLRDSKWWAIEKFQMACAFHSKVKNRDDGVESNEIAVTIEPTVEKINSVEVWFQDELPSELKDATWEINMSGIFIEYNFGEEALQRGRAAATLDPTNWRTNFALAYAYALEGDGQDLASAIDEMSLVAEKFRSDPILMADVPKVFSDQVLANLGKWKADLKQYESAMEIYDELLNRFPDRSQTLLDVLELLKRQEKVSEIGDYLRKLNTQIDEGGLSRLIGFYHKFSRGDHSIFCDIISSTLKETESMTFVRETLQIAIEAIILDDTKRAIAMSLRFWYGHLLYHVAECDSDQDEALKVWEENLTLRPSEAMIRNHQLWTIEQLAPAYLNRAKILGFEKPCAQELLGRLKELPKRLDERELHWIYINDLVGRGCSLMGEPENARQSLRKDVHDALVLLSDDDPTNDWQGYRALALALIPLSDDENALAAWSLMCPTTTFRDDSSSSSDTDPGDKECEATVGAERVNTDGHSIEQVQVDDDGAQKATESPAEPSPEDAADTSIKKDRKIHEISSRNSDDGPLGGSCDGGCGRIWSFPDDMHCCKDCQNLQLDTPCYEKFKDGSFKLPETRCHPSHDFLYVPAWDPTALQALPPDSVKVGERVLTIKEWLDGIKKDWGFDNMIS